jgi:hypothetical protein
MEGDSVSDQPCAEGILRRKARNPGHGPVRRLDPMTGRVIEIIDVTGRLNWKKSIPWNQFRGGKPRER